MPSSYTENYHLPQYAGSDVINPLVDTNGAYLTIDTTLDDHEDRIAALEAGGGSAETGTLTAKNLTFSFRRNGNCCHVDVTGTTSATIENNSTWSETVASDFLPAVNATSVPIFPADINNSGLGITIDTAGAISSKTSVGTIAVGATIKCSFDYPCA